jgi:hypothetical protein
LTYLWWVKGSAFRETRQSCYFQTILQYEFTDFCSFHFQDEESLGREEEVEHVGREEDLEVAGLEETSDGGQDFVEEEDEEEDGHDDEEEGHEESAGLDDEGVGVTGLLQDPHPHTDLGLATLFALL